MKIKISRSIILLILFVLSFDSHAKEDAYNNDPLFFKTIKKVIKLRGKNDYNKALKILLEEEKN